MKAGDKVKHKLTGEILTIKKSFDGVFTCYLNTAHIIFGNVEVDTCVCLSENLELL